MRRADRLFQIVQLLRRSRATTAAQLATALEVAPRTIYRDVQDLVLSSIPIQGEAGVGYALPPHFELPPLMFDAAEIEALALGARMVQGWSDESLARAARSALSKIENVLPPALAERVAHSRLFVPAFHVPKEQQATLQQAREALDAHRLLRLSYGDENGRRSRRDVRPLGLFYWGRTWTLTGWCELRTDFRSFRLDRIGRLTVLARTFQDENGKRLEDFLARVGAEGPPATAPRPPVAKTPKARRGAGPTGPSDPSGPTGPSGPSDPAERAAWRTFQQLGSVGPACAHDLVQLGFRRIDELRGQDPNDLFARLCELTHSRQDPCVEDTLRCVIAQAEHADLPPEWRQWFRWTPLRGHPAGALPAELRSRRGSRR